MSCTNNLKQLGLALHNYDSAFGYFPPSTVTNGNSAGQPWSGQSFILPYVEGATIYQRINFGQGYHHADNKSLLPPSGVAATRVPVLLCPSETNDRVRTDSAGVAEHYPLSYAMNMGTYLVYNPVTQQNGGGAFGPNAKINSRDFIDGLSSTLAYAEVKTYTPRFNDCILPTTPPVSPDVVATSYITGGSWSANGGHTEWVCGRAIHTGFTTTFAPNTRVPYQLGSVTYDIDVTSSREGRNATDATYSVITSRSYHQGMVHALRMDGSVRSIAENIALDVWRAMGTRNGGEVIE